MTLDIEESLIVLKNGGIILYPTDTVWGLGCDATNAKAIERIFAIKNRPVNKSMIVLLADERDILQYVTNINLEIFNYLQGVKKPTTIIYNDVIGLAENALAADGSTAIRVVDEPFCKHLIKRFRKPIISTSANISNQPTPLFFNQISAEIKAQVDYIVQYKQEDTTVNQPSAIVKYNADGSITTIRS